MQQIVRQPRPQRQCREADPGNEQRVLLGRECAIGQGQLRDFLRQLQENDALPFAEDFGEARAQLVLLAEGVAEFLIARECAEVEFLERDVHDRDGVVERGFLDHAGADQSKLHAMPERIDAAVVPREPPAGPRVGGIADTRGIAMPQIGLRANRDRHDEALGITLRGFNCHGGEILRVVEHVLRSQQGIDGIRVAFLHPQQPLHGRVADRVLGNRDRAEAIQRAGLKAEIDGGALLFGIDDKLVAGEVCIEKALGGRSPQQARLHLFVGAVVEPAAGTQVATRQQLPDLRVAAARAGDADFHVRQKHFGACLHGDGCLPVSAVRHDLEVDHRLVVAERFECAPGLKRDAALESRHRVGGDVVAVGVAAETQEGADVVGELIAYARDFDRDVRLRKRHGQQRRQHREAGTEAGLQWPTPARSRTPDRRRRLHRDRGCRTRLPAGRRS